MKTRYFKKPGFLKQGENLLYNPTISNNSADSETCCCVDFESLPKSIVPFTQNTLRPDTGYSYLSHTYHYVSPAPSYGNPTQLYAELNTYSMRHREKELFRQKIEELVGILIKTCPDYATRETKTIKVTHHRISQEKPIVGRGLFISRDEDLTLKGRQ